MPLPLSVMKKLGSPLPADQLEVIEAGLNWDDFQVNVYACVQMRD
jgi:hypothetical protein